MHLHEIIAVSGCITQEHFIKGKTLSELERLLGFQKGRLANGAVVAALIQMPTAHQFDLLGYSQVAQHKFGSTATAGLDKDKLKEMVIKEVFTLAGNKRLVKIMANSSHNNHLDNDVQYPPGSGVPQWKLAGRVSARVINIIEPEMVHH